MSNIGRIVNTLTAMVKSPEDVVRDAQTALDAAWAEEEAAQAAFHAAQDALTAARNKRHAADRALAIAKLGLD